MGADTPVVSSPIARSGSQTLVLCVVVGSLYWLHGWRPFLIQAWTVVDAGLYLRHAEKFVLWLTGRGREWLGSWDAFLLAKTPFYGMWLGLVHLSGIPLRVAEFALLIAGGFLFRQAIRSVRVLRFWEFVVILCLLTCNPALPIDIILARTSLQSVLSNLALIACIGFALRATGGSRARYRWALLTGVFFSFCYLNREEAAWISAAVFVAFLIHWVVALLYWRGRLEPGRQALKKQAVTLTMFALGAAPSILFVCAMNRIHYGAFTTTFRRDAALGALYQRLTSLEPAGHQRYIPITRVTRMKAYELSPTFARMKPFLEGTDGYWHAGNEHSEMNGHKASEQEFFVSYFEFSLVWAAEKMGAKNAGQVQEIFRAIDRELAQAIRDKKIAAGRSGPSILAAPVAGDGGRLVGAFWQSLTGLLRVKLYDYGPFAGRQSPAARLDEVAQLFHSSVGLPPQNSIHYKMRAPILNSIRRIETLLYPVFFLVLPAVLIWRWRKVLTARPSQITLMLWTSIVPFVGLLAFCFSMAVVDVLGFHFLHTMGYNVLGFAPLSVLCAFVFCLLCALRLPEFQDRQPSRAGDAQAVQA